MIKKDELCVVQLLHPGKEPRPNGDGRTPWNVDKHRRKFLSCRGRYVRDASGSDERQGEIVFWGEWEPESRTTELVSESEGEPTYLHEPYFVLPNGNPRRQNTDPFVFGPQFLYSVCKQNTMRGPTQMRRLVRGSVILFGSYVASRFLLDTVFVVEGFVDHDARGWRKQVGDMVDPAFRIVTLERTYGRSKTKSLGHRLYFGATPDKPVEGMFSFFPCKPRSGNRGFARPAVKIRGALRSSLKQGKKVTPGTLAEMKGYWGKVVEQVLGQELALGVHAVVPPERKKSELPGSMGRARSTSRTTQDSPGNCRPIC